MRQTQMYFLIIGIVLSLIISFFSARHQKNQGHSFVQTFLFGFLGLVGFTFWFWQWWFNVK